MAMAQMSFHPSDRLNHSDEAASSDVAAAIQPREHEGADRQHGREQQEVLPRPLTRPSNQRQSTDRNQARD
jgi:hypothetical protein